MKVATHLAIHPDLVGKVVDLSEGRATCELLTSTEMSADDRGLVHGGFVFGLADFAAMVAVNDPHVVLGSAEARFVAPVRVGDRVLACATVVEAKGKKRRVECVARVGERDVFLATFTALVLDRHVLDT
jgi:acyl-coenzyme A thioesterase PaaI-like protein